MRILKLAAIAAAAIAASTQAAILDPSFETQGAASAAGSPNGYCYFAFPAGGNDPCAAGAWSGTGNSGIQLETNSPFPGQPTPDGSYYGFVQNIGSFSQTFTADASGSFVLNFLEAGRPLNGGSAGNEQYNVTLNGTPIFTGASTTGQAFTARTSGAFALTAGQSYTLAFNGTGAGPDDTAYIDAISLAAVPEPAAWALLIAGFGIVGGALRRRGGAQALTA